MPLAVAHRAIVIRINGRTHGLTSHHFALVAEDSAAYRAHLLATIRSQRLQSVSGLRITVFPGCRPPKATHAISRSPSRAESGAAHAATRIAQAASGAPGTAPFPDDGSQPAAARHEKRQQKRTEKTKRKGVPAILSRAAGVCAEDHANAHGSAGPACRFASFQNQK